MNAMSLLRRLPVRFAALGMFATLALGVAAPATAFAAPATTTGCASDVQCIITFGDARIALRETALQKLSGRIAAHEANGRLTADQASALQSEVTANEQGLTTLKARLDAETDPTAARTDVKNIYQQFRIFAVVLPRDYSQMWLEILTHVDTRLKNLEPQIQDAINSAPASERAQLNKLFSDYKAQLADAEGQMDAAQGVLPLLTIQRYNNDKLAYRANLMTLHNDLKTAHGNIKQAASDLHQMVRILKGISASSSATATPVATANS